ncbi:cold shock domain-containing protein [Streptomyces sp. NPDC052109]|uniref:cold-shock protein n=1 Tax=Streptomyces sp. NPDC052109 TaxID=3155527 RepID=UPI00342A5108
MEPDEDGPDLFVFHKAIQHHHIRSLTEGQKVEYTAGHGPKGPEAEEVIPM